MVRRSIIPLIAACLFVTACDDEDSPKPQNGQEDPKEDPDIQPETCIVGETRCDGYTLLECSYDNKFVSHPCGAKKICATFDGKSKCMTQQEYDEMSTPKQCEADETKCDDGELLYTCNESGKWNDPVDCIESGKICRTKDGKSSCFKWDCTPGESKCISDTIYKCNSEGQFVEGKDCSASNPPLSCEMKKNTASCVSSCTNNTKRCTADGQLETCFYGMFVAETCFNGKTCTVEDGVADCREVLPDPECTTGDTKCNENNLDLCVAGFWQTVPCQGESSCRTDPETSKDACMANPCQNGATRCGAANVLYTCVEGTWTETHCLKMNPIRYCSADGNPDATGELDKAACIEPASGDTVIDSDNDTIPDITENRALNLDTDGDGIPDYLDLDSDGDTIPDSVEAANEGNPNIPPNDSDYDGIPNYLDLDSDGNDIPDSIEVCPSGADCQIISMAMGVDAAGNPLAETFMAVTAPNDLDEDSVPDYLDSDNDGDGFSDHEEIIGLISPTHFPGAGKFSGSCHGGNIATGKYGYQGTPEEPLQCDRDGIPDYMDTDSDNDGLSDKLEGLLIRNGYYARYSTDVDADEVSDYRECYPLRPDGSCNDSDDDGVPDLLELDSDNDGVPDKDEARVKSDRTKPDSDGDNAPDIVEYAICVDENNGQPPASCPAMSDPNSNPQSDGNFVFTTPFKGQSDPPQTLSLETAIQTVDIFFAFDQSGSMRQEVYSLKSSLNTMLSELQCADLGRECKENRDCKGLGDAICSEKGRCITNPGANEGCLNDMWTGLGFFHRSNSFWVASHLSEGATQTMNMLTAMFLDPNNQDSFRQSGNSEAPYNAPICAILGPKAGIGLCQQGKEFTTNCASNLTAGGSLGSCRMNCTTDTTKIGCVGYRPSAIRLYVQAFDENECSSNQFADTEANCASFEEHAGATLFEQAVRWIGLWSGPDSCAAISNKIGVDSDSVDEDNHPFTYKALDSALAENAKQGIMSIAKTMSFEITSSVEDLNSDNLNARKLIASVNVHLEGGDSAQGHTCTSVTENVTSTTNDDGIILEGIESALPGKTLCFDVVPVDFQELFPATNIVQIKKARVKVMGDGSVLNSGIAYFIIPPIIESSNN